MPVLGDGTYDWLGLVPNWDKPSAMEPERGYIVTNNHRVVPPGYKYNLGWDTAVSLRA
jgi:penicillin amidase